VRKRPADSLNSPLLVIVAISSQERKKYHLNHYLGFVLSTIEE
jgi:hypothetical protein